jgi:hypothetical protein
MRWVALRKEPILGVEQVSGDLQHPGAVDG